MKLSAQVSLFSRVTFVDKLLFTKHLSIMLKSGITIVEALDIISSQAKASAFKKVLQTIVNDIKNGKSLSSSLTKYPHIFNAFYCSIVEIGETSGTLDESLAYLSSQLAKEHAFRKKVRGALIYPTIVVVAALIVGFGLSIFVLPKLLELFENFEIPLPWTTQVLLFVANTMENYGIVVILLTILALFLFRFLINLSAIKPIWHNIILSMPIFGSLLLNAELTSFCRNLGIMLKSGLTITTALDIQVKVADNLVFKEYVMRMLKAIDQGKSLATEIETGHYPQIPLVVTKMMTVGEKTGKLEETLLYLGDFFEEEVDDATHNISTTLEPIMLLIIGVIVAFVALAIISPIYQLTGSIQR